jgi:hypothetical protein
MNNLSISSPNNPLIKSWFGFALGSISIALSIFGLSKSFDLAGILSTLGFLCFWYPWSQMTGWNNPIKNFFKADNQAMSKLSTYLVLIATVLLVSSVIVGLVSN